MAEDATKSTRPAETVRKVAEQALSDAVEITLLIGLMRGQNAGGVNKELAEAGAGRAAGAIRHALTARLVLLIARAYANVKQGDVYLRAGPQRKRNPIARPAVLLSLWAAHANGLRKNSRIGEARRLSRINRK